MKTDYMTIVEEYLKKLEKALEKAKEVGCTFEKHGDNLRVYIPYVQIHPTQEFACLPLRQNITKAHFNDLDHFEILLEKSEILSNKKSRLEKGVLEILDRLKIVLKFSSTTI